jgi:hypothetical protein
MKKILVSLCAAALLLTQVSFVFAFSDMNEGDVYYDSVMYLSGKGVVTGYPDGTFGYASTINRAELLTIIVKSVPADEQPDNVQWLAYSNESCFADVTAGQWYTQYVCFAKDKGWVGGYPDSTFKPSQPVNFVEALKISMSSHNISFDNGTSPWYKGLVDSASEKNLIPLTITSFDQKIPRGEMADLIARVMNYEAGTSDEFLGDLKDIVVTYETISNGINMYPGASGDDTSTGIIEPYDTSFDFDDDGNYSEINGIDLSNKSNFQALFEDNNAQIAGNYAIDKYDILYFTVSSQGGDAAVRNRIIAYDYNADAVIVLYDEESVGTEESLGVGEKLRLLGMDLDNSVLVVQFEPYEYMMPLCWSPWVDEYENLELSLVEYNGLIPYTTPQWKIDEAQGMVDQCLEAM